MNTKHPFETVEASADVMKLAEMILSDCGCSTSISDRLQRRVAGRIQQHMDSALGGQKVEPTEPGLYAILYRDNWDGEGDTSYLLARLDPNGEWYAEESDAQLMTYEGDAILRAWPITEDTAMQPDPRPVLNCWCCSTLVTFKQRADADGNCPHCGAELDVDKDLADQWQAEPAAPAVKESLTAEPQAEQVTLCASCARANVDCPIYPQQTGSCVEYRGQQQAVAVPDDAAILTHFHAAKDQDAHLYSDPGEVVYQLTQADLLQAARAMLAAAQKGGAE